MALYNDALIQTLHQANLKDAQARLSGLEVFCGCPAAFGGLNGWVFEQTIQFCLRIEKRIEKRDASHFK